MSRRVLKHGKWTLKSSSRSTPISFRGTRRTYSISEDTCEFPDGTIVRSVSTELDHDSYEVTILPDIPSSIERPQGEFSARSRHTFLQRMPMVGFVFGAISNTLTKILTEAALSGVPAEHFPVMLVLMLMMLFF